MASSPRGSAESAQGAQRGIMAAALSHAGFLAGSSFRPALPQQLVYRGVRRAYRLAESIAPGRAPRRSGGIPAGLQSHHAGLSRRETRPLSESNGGSGRPLPGECRCAGRRGAGCPVSGALQTPGVRGYRVRRLRHRSSSETTRDRLDQRPRCHRRCRRNSRRNRPHDVRWRYGADPAALELLLWRRGAGVVPRSGGALRQSYFAPARHGVGNRVRAVTAAAGPRSPLAACRRSCRYRQVFVSPT